MGCPYQGEVHPQKVEYVSKRLLDLGCYQISLGDTIGSGTPYKTNKMLDEVKCLDNKNMAIHFHDTGDSALVNIMECLKRGIEVIDSSVGGLGGCPYAKTANGNVATENVLYLLH